MTALGALIGLKPSSTTGLVVRELALDFSLATYRPTFFQHLPGVHNATSDLLSRWTPSSRLPAILSEARRDFPPLRERSYYRTLHLPPRENRDASIGS
eukprot:5877282-Amphidinium_carterae.1